MVEETQSLIEMLAQSIVRAVRVDWTREPGNHSVKDPVPIGH